MTNPTLVNLCAEAMISRSTLGRWLADPKSNQALAEAEGRAISDTSRVLLVGSESALGVLRNLMINSTNDSVRRQAANDWLSYMFKSYELQTLEARVTALEAMQNEH